MSYEGDKAEEVYFDYLIELDSQNHKSRANVCQCEKSAINNIMKAQETIDFWESLDKKD